MLAVAWGGLCWLRLGVACAGCGLGRPVLAAAWGGGVGCDVRGAVACVGLWRVWGCGVRDGSRNAVGEQPWGWRKRVVIGWY